ncbi:hypothetical protein CJ739_89 [Mariniflexile rhizosphaerae]|uniref:hypothetical protein n=1 Tax=unclassified Mariniflexile TaxID=2643887 RepID=UPI000E32FF47|nr:hypothetical protein [Mariniflexile sp. TRM1-10]AXP79189.1 hypothetical protein CJ739_89 [Mariniflexile sp. TRM1-10]
MERIKVNSNFYLDEFVDPYTYFNNNDNGLSLVDERLFQVAQLLRFHYMSPVYINNWWKLYLKYKDTRSIPHIIQIIERENEKDNVNIWSGIRTSRCNIGSKLSAHKIQADGKGMAIDPKGNELIFFLIVKNNAEVFYHLGVRRLEDISITPGWLHIDLLERNTKPNSIRVVDRTKSTKTLYF